MTTPRPAACLILLFSYLASPVVAENRLFPTDLLEPGEIEVSLGVAVVKSEGRFEDTSGPNGMTLSSTRYKAKTYNESIGAGYSPAPDWQLSIGLNHTSGGKGSIDYEPDPPAGSSYQDQTIDFGSRTGNLAFSLSYRFTEDKASRFAVVGSGGVTPSTAGHHTPLVYGAGLAASWRFDGGLDAYSVYSGSRVEHGSGVSDRLTAGLRQRFGDAFAVKPSVTYSQASTAHHSERPLFGIEGHLQLATRTYLIPSFSYQRPKTTYRSSPWWNSREEQRFEAWSISLYHLF